MLIHRAFAMGRWRDGMRIAYSGRYLRWLVHSGRERLFQAPLPLPRGPLRSPAGRQVTLTPQVVSQLGALVLDADNHPKGAKGFSPKQAPRACVSLEDRDAALLPQAVRFPCMSFGVTGQGRPLSTFLRRAKQLRVLHLYRAQYQKVVLDPKVLTSAFRLRVLMLTRVQLDPPMDLGRLAELRVLILTALPGLRSLAFVRQLKKLQFMNLASGTVTDLSPLADHPTLRWVRVVDHPVTKLPRGKMPALRYLEVLNSRLAAAEIRQFRRRNPKCRVITNWLDALRETAAQADRVELLVLGLGWPRPPGNNAQRFSAKGAANVSRVLKRLRLAPKKGFLVTRVGGTELVFYRGKYAVATVSVRDDGVVGHRGWPGKARLTKRSLQFLRQSAKRGRFAF